AILWGPLVLAGDLGPEPPRRAAERTPPQDSPVFVAANKPVGDWLKPIAGRPGDFKTDGVGRDRDVELVPFYRLQHRTYTAYWGILSPADFDKRTADHAAERERIRRLESVTLAFHAPGEADAESAVNQQGEETTIVRADGHPGRRAARWFSYDLPIGAA